MIEAVKRSAGVGGAGTVRYRRVEPAAKSASAGSHLPALIVASEATSHSDEIAARLAVLGGSTAFAVQLAVSTVGGESGERRSHRDPSLVTARANGSYRETRALVSAIETGFLTKVSY